MLDIWTFQESFKKSEEEGIDFSFYNGHLMRLLGDFITRINLDSQISVSIQFWDIINIFLTPDAIHSLSCCSKHCTTLTTSHILTHNSIISFNTFLYHFVDHYKYCLLLMSGTGSQNLECKNMYYN